MGTRSIACIYHNGRFVYAQVEGHDGYPEVRGLLILRWLLVEGNIQRLLEKTDLLQPPPTHDEDYENLPISFDRITASSCPIEHVCQLYFANDGRFYEWAYVVDLDAGVLEVYQGDGDFHGIVKGRFAETNVVEQVLKATFSFTDLPSGLSGDDDFVQACRREDGPTMPGGWRLPQVPQEFEAELFDRQNAFIRRQITLQDVPVAFQDQGEVGDGAEPEDDDDNDEIETGTRHLVCIYHKGAFVVAQHGDWDGNPEFAGMAILRFLTPDNIQRLRERIHLVPPPMPRNIDYDSKAASILRDVASATRTVKHNFQLGFASNGAMCEWCYVVDLDDGVLEVYRSQSAGRVPRQLPPYRSVRVVAGAGRLVEAGVTQQGLQAVFRFDDLPGDEDVFMEACGGVRGEDGYFDWSL
jgi:hypothetical protein